MFGATQPGLHLMDIMLHLGAHRSASTTFQSFLWTNRARLAQRGLSSWTPRRTRDGLMSGLMRAPAKITVEDERKAIRSIGRMRVEIERLQRAGQDALLISEENMIGSMRNIIAERRLYPLLDERFLRFKPVFLGHKLRIGLSIRSYEDFWTSSLMTRLVRGGAAPSVDVLDFLTTQPRRWRHVVRDIAATFPEAEIVVWPFERLASNPNAQLGALWGRDCYGLVGNDTWKNRSPNLLSLNETMKMRGEEPCAKNAIDAGARWMPFDEDQRNVLRAEYRYDLAWFKSGAQGLATFIDGQSTPKPTTVTTHISGQLMSAQRPDRAEVTRTSVQNAVPLRGRQDGIEKSRIENGMGRTGAS